MVQLTPAGLSAIEAAAPNHVTTVRRFFFDPLSDDELDTLATLFDRLLAGLTDSET
jgi:DNA-binding MarR family transcriptional regulator